LVGGQEGEFVVVGEVGFEVACLVGGEVPGELDGAVDVVRGLGQVDATLDEEREVVAHVEQVRLVGGEGVGNVVAGGEVDLVAHPVNEIRKVSVESGMKRFDI